MRYLTWSVFHVIGLIISSVFSTEIRVTGPHETITGDFEKFTCEITGDEVTSTYGFEWKFKLKNGEYVGMNDSDILTGLEIRNYYPRQLTVTSFLRTDNPDIVSVICQHSPKMSGSKDIEVKDLTAITADNDPCNKVLQSGEPATSIFLPSTDISAPSYRRSHYIGGQNVELLYEVDEIRLVCYSPSEENPPKWSFNREMANKMKYAAWAQQSTKHACKQQVLHIYQVAGESGKITQLELDCTAGSNSLKINLGLSFPASRARMDFNSTENCINEIVDTFYKESLTGVGVGGSLTILLMMVGIAFLKRQVNQQKNINRELQNKNQNGSTTQSVGSTGLLNSNNHNNHNDANTNYP